MPHISLPDEKEASFQGVIGAIRRQFKIGGRSQQRRIGQSVRAAGLRTSGVGQIPVIAADQSRQAAESSAIAGLGQQRLGQLGSLEQIREQIAGRLNLFRQQAGFAREEGRAGRASELRNALIKGIGGVIAGRFGR